MQLIWEEFLKIIKEEAGSQIVETWFKAVSFEEWNAHTSTVTLHVPNQFVSKWVKEHYSELLKKHLARLLHTQVLNLNFICLAQTTSPTPRRNIIPASVVSTSSYHTNKKFQPDSSATPFYETKKLPTVHITPKNSIVASSKRGTGKERIQLNKKYNFDNFVVGASNTLAHAASYAICEDLGKVYNPLFIYGGTGLGKTHLLHAIGNEVRKHDTNLIIRYETSDNFINEFINSIRFDRSQQFRKKYQTIDLFLFDDIQFLSNKEQTQEVLFHIFNILHEQQKQIVFSSDTFPKEITGLQNRLKSRMECGLVADIQIPDLETKIAILKKKAEVHSIILPNDVAHFIASRVISNIRELEGSLIRIGAFASLTNQQINLSLAKKVLLNLNNPLLNNSKNNGALLEKILKTVSKHYDIPTNEIRSKKRRHDVAVARQVTFYLMKKISASSLQVIGGFIGGRDHSTVIHAIGKVEVLQEKDQMFSQRIKSIENEILST